MPLLVIAVDKSTSAGEQGRAKRRKRHYTNGQLQTSPVDIEILNSLIQTNMRKLIAAMNMTLDGFCDHTAMSADDEIH